MFTPAVFAAIGDPLSGVTPLNQGAPAAVVQGGGQRSRRHTLVYGLFEVQGAYFAHHAAAMSMAAVRREAEAVERGTDAREFRRMHSGFYIARPDTA